MFRDCFLYKRNAEHRQKHVSLEARLRCSGFIGENSTRIHAHMLAIVVFIGVRMDLYCTTVQGLLACTCRMVQTPFFLGRCTLDVDSMHCNHSSDGTDCKHQSLWKLSVALNVALSAGQLQIGEGHSMAPR